MVIQGDVCSIGFLYQIARLPDRAVNGSLTKSQKCKKWMEPPRITKYR